MQLQAKALTVKTLSDSEIKKMETQIGELKEFAECEAAKLGQKAEMIMIG